MPDADWVRYTNIRGRPLPAELDSHGQTYRLEKLLKFDFYAATGLYVAENQSSPELPRKLIFKRYHTDPDWFPPLRWLALALARREIHYLRRLDGIEGVPGFYRQEGPSGLVREYVEGTNLREYFYRDCGYRPGPEFFPRLFKILETVHQRGVAHNDLSKPENLIVRPDGSPALIDLQIAREARIPLVGRSIIRYLQANDRYHVEKLHRRYRPNDFSGAGRTSAALAKHWTIRLHGRFRRPYRALRHYFLDRFFTRHDEHALPGPHLPAAASPSYHASVRRSPSSKSTPTS
jgi:serine/threonine protein kinase